MAELVLGPLLRYVDQTSAVVWVETGEPCEVQVLGSTAPTFTVEGHHYGVVQVRDLKPGTTYEYERASWTASPVWPPKKSKLPGSFIRTYTDDIQPHDRVRVLPGGGAPRAAVLAPQGRGRPRPRGRRAAHHRAPDARPGSRPRGPTCCCGWATRSTPTRSRPRRASSSSSGATPSEEPGCIALDFEEYCKLYYESWNEPVTRWLLSTVSSAMIFDDHDIHDDWNTSAAWVEEIRKTDWWDEHIKAGLMSYWIYQHVGNLSPDEQDEDGLLGRLQHLTDGTTVLREYARGSDREAGYSRWSFHRDVGRTRVVVIDSRCGRQLEEGNRSMLDDDEWQWVEDHATGGFDHLLIATSLPWLLGPGHAPPRGLERGRLRAAPGAGSPPSWARRSARTWTWSTGPPSTSRSSGWPRSSAPSAPASAARPRPRSSRSPATCTTPT